MSTSTPASLMELLAYSHATNPVFQGTNEEREANRKTHFMYGDEGRCTYCDCRLFGVHYDFPCRNALDVHHFKHEVAKSTQPHAYWTDVTLVAIFDKSTGEEWWQVNALKAGTDWFSINRLDTIDEALETFKLLTNEGVIK